MIFKVCDMAESFADMYAYMQSVGEAKNIYLLTGNLGAGKTTFVKYFYKADGGDIDEVDSPTFSIVNTYKSKNGVFHHFDLYRLETAEEIEDIGFMEYIDSGNVCFIEWPEKIAEFLPSERIVNVEISLSLNGCRDYSFS
ncbi:tRNA (adenosine(37)-N6)-threonylcarbamoyltransferase complex ATPase subunit type 1 TsaE [Bacteroidia bacterium]|nr:tRNA (adenosine(37)-N6)-threonylcarbamoyltransferase complex ATPase subunit type 1 TsaE [Bacteroidia bacterium]